VGARVLYDALHLNDGVVVRLPHELTGDKGNPVIGLVKHTGHHVLIDGELDGDLKSLCHCLARFLFSDLSLNWLGRLGVFPIVLSIAEYVVNVKGFPGKD
jgi:hypothetical protein